MSNGQDSPRISLRDIAAMLGVSHSTISLALRDHPRISEEVRVKVKEKAAELGYRPDPMLAALANYRRGRGGGSIQAGVAWVNGWANPNDLRAHREFDDYWRGAGVRAAVVFGFHRGGLFCYCCEPGQLSPQG